MSEHRGALTQEGELYPSPRRTLDYLDVDPPEPGHAVEIGAGLRWARIPLPMELNHINVWLLRLDDGWMLVDTGLSHDVCREAWHSLEAQHLDGLGLRRLFVTHDHPDHMGLSRWLHERHQAPLSMSAIGHGSTRDYLASSPDHLQDLQHAFVTSHGMHVERQALSRGAGSEHGAWYGGLPPLARAATGGEWIQAAGREWELIETSGHCRGHLCLYDAQNQVLISGDQVLPTISPNVSVLPSRPESNPLRDFLESLATLEQRCAQDTLVLPSHGRPFRGLHRRIESLRSHHLEQLENLRVACREPRAAYDLLPVMYGRPLRGYHRFLALGETVAHLHYLWQAGQVERNVDGDGRIRFAAA
jgi:glyoxylase-like metal-dependent hydrolase (beta-lactamase superfamily II)